MRRHTLVPVLLALGSASCTFSNIEDGFDALFGDHRPNASPTEPSVPIAQVVRQKNLVSNLPDIAAHQDPNLVNAWGLAFNPTGPAWVSDAETGFTTVYDPNGILLLTVTVPPPAEGMPPSAPTGQVFNGDTTSFMGDRFIFVTEDGTISGWQPNFDGAAQLRFDNSESSAVYKGVAVAKVGDKSRLYATDFHNAKVDVIDSNYQPEGSCNGGFVDPKLPDKTDDDPGPGRGVVDLYDTQGNFLQRLISGGMLNSPWGMAMTPGGYGRIPDRLLVGNFGDGHISAFKLSLDGLRLAATFEGFLGAAKNHALVIDGLWSIAFPPNAGGFDARHLYFTAGPNDEENGLFGRLELVNY